MQSKIDVLANLGHEVAIVSYAGFFIDFRCLPLTHTKYILATFVVPDSAISGLQLPPSYETWPRP